MLLHNLKQIFRGLWRYKSFTFINFMGLSIGIAAIVLLYLIAQHERSFDHLHADNNKIYRVVSEQPKEGKIENTAKVPYPTAKFFRNEYAGALATEIHFDRDRSIKIEGHPAIRETNIVFADSLFFKVMDFSQIKNFWIKGNPEKALEAPNKAILTESTAMTLYGNEDPIGKLFKLENKVDIEVVGLVKDIPANTHLPVNLFISFSTLNDKSLMAGLDVNYWGFRSNGYCYVKIDDNAKPQVVQALNAVIQKNAQNDLEKKEKLSLQPLSAIHFDSKYEDSNANYTISEQYLKMLLLLGAFITLIACVNYVNLSTSLAFSKSKEVGIRKTIGASKSQLFFYYLLETVIVTVIAAVIGLVTAYITLPLINQWLEKSISITNLLNVQFFITAFLFIIIISIISGAYPALVLSRFNPIATLKSQLVVPGKASALLRKGLVVFQFTTSIVLIICTIVIAMQVKYFTTKSLGFNKDAVVEVALPESDSARRESLKAQLQNQAGIKNLSFCLGAPVSHNDISTNFKAPELSANVEYSIKVIPCDDNYLETDGLQLLAGRWLLPGEIKNEGSAIVVNETTVKTLGYKNPSDAIGKKVQIGINDYTPLIVGVTKDFHTTSLHQAITPVALMPFHVWYYAAAVRIDPLNMKQSLAKIESAWRKIYPNDVYEIKFIDEALAERYKQEQKDYILFKAFSAISLFICCIGLWGLIAFVVVRKTKEIGIRKVLGATVSSIVGLLSKDFLKLVLMALLVASPIAWYFMNQWLQSFAYRISISWWVFALAGLFAVAIALFTISFQAIKAALANPTKNLRTE